MLVGKSLDFLSEEKMSSVAQVAKACDLVSQLGEI